MDKASTLFTSKAHYKSPLPRTSRNRHRHRTTGCSSAMAHVPAIKTTPFWTDEKHVHFLNNMEASFVRSMLENKSASTRLDRYLPDTSDSTLDLKPHPRRRTKKHHAPSAYSMGPTTRRTRRRSSQPYINSSQDQVVPHVENEREGASCNADDDTRAEN